MTWFKVDDSFHSHPKVLACDADALGLWVVAGSWSSANLTDGFVSDRVLPRLLPGAEELAKKLVAAGLWRRARGGFRFHDWGHFNPTAEQVKKEREAARERMAKKRAADRGKGVDNSPHEEEQQVRRGGVRPNKGRTFGRSSASPTRPDPNLLSGGSGSGGGAPSGAPTDPTAGRHPYAATPEGPCATCHLPAVNRYHVIEGGAA